MNVDDPVECPVAKIREKYVVIDGSDIHDSPAGSKSSSETGDDRQGEEEDPAEDETWDLPTRRVGDIISVKVTCPVDQDNDVWAEIVDDFRAVVDGHNGSPTVFTLSLRQGMSLKRSRLWASEVNTSFAKPRPI